MASLSLEQKTQLAAQIVETACRIYAPKDTGNLSLNAIRSVYEDGLWQVVIGGEVAPYAIYTNEEWINRGGRENPNKHWIEDAIESVKSVIVNIFSGTYTIEQIEAYQSYLDLMAEDTIFTRTRGEL
jgi:hypothetical protein